MKNNFVQSQSQDVFSANEAQMKKIEFLTRQKNKADMYIKDLEQSLKINKQAVKSMNKDNNKTILLLNQQNITLHKRLHSYYQQIRDSNALRLFEGQIRIQDKSFYNERVIQFENRISDLRKYLHDKEDSFSTVVSRLKKYEFVQQTPLSQKLAAFKDELGKDITPQIFKSISVQKNKYQKLYAENILNKKKFEVLQYALKNSFNYEKLRAAIFKAQQQFLLQNSERVKLKQLFQNTQINSTKNSKNQIDFSQHKISENPNKQLIRLLKKQKISNQLLQDTLNEAIQKNQELLNVNDKLIEANKNLQEIANELRSQILVLEGYLSQFDENYRRKNPSLHSKCDLLKPAYKYSDFSNEITRKDLLKKLKKDVDKITQFMTSTSTKKKMFKSCSGPRLISEQQQLEIQQI